MSAAGCSVSDRESPWVTLLTGTRRARSCQGGGERGLGERHVTSVGKGPGGNIIVKRDHAARSGEGACACDNYVVAAAVDLGRRDGVELPGEGICERQRSLRIAATAHMVAVEVNAANEVLLPRCLDRPTWLAITADVERVGLPAPDQAALHRV